MCVGGRREGVLGMIAVVYTVDVASTRVVCESVRECWVVDI